MYIGSLDSVGRGVITSLSMCWLCDKNSFCWFFKDGVSEVLQSSGESGVYIGSICRTLSTYVLHHKSPFTKDDLYFIALLCVWYAHYLEGGLEGILT